MGRVGWTAERLPVRAGDIGCHLHLVRRNAAAPVQPKLGALQGNGGGDRQRGRDGEGHRRAARQPAGVRHAEDKAVDADIRGERRAGEGAVVCDVKPSRLRAVFIAAV